MSDDTLPEVPEGPAPGRYSTKASETFSVNLRCDSRADGVRKFVEMACEYFGVSRDHLAVEITHAGIETIENWRGDIILARRYDMSFNGWIRREPE